MCVILDKAEATGCLLEAIKTHDEAFDFTNFGEELVDLFFGCVEGPREELVVLLRNCGVEKPTYKLPT